MAKTMRHGSRRGKAVRSSKTFAATVAEAVRYAHSLRGKGLTWTEVSNALFGPGVMLTQLCPTEADRVALAKTPEYQCFDFRNGQKTDRLS